MQYLALLRGINVGGNVLIKMSDLAKALEAADLEGVKTLLASGNVLFESKEKNSRALAKKLEATLEKKFGRTIRTIVRPIHDIEMLAKSDPFKGVPLTKDVRFYVTFLNENAKKHLRSPSPFFRVVKTCPFAVCTVLILTPNRGSIDLMSTVEKHYGADITTRNWNTVQKILKAAQTDVESRHGR